MQTLIYMEELAKRRIVRSLHFPGYAIVAPSLLDFGNDEQRALAAAVHSRRPRVVHRHERTERRKRPRVLTTRAERDGDHFVVNGQKVWTSYSMVAAKCFCYVRTTTTRPGAEAQGHHAC